MSRPRAPAPCLAVFGLLVSPAVCLADVLDDVAATLAPVTALSPELSFTQSGYYEREMGRELRRVYGAVEGLWDPERLPGLKRAAHALEDRWREGGGRRVNLDPGLLSLTQVVLASAKPSGHRIYLGQGVYGEIEYVFGPEGFQPLPWTYPDYRAPAALAFFNELRKGYKAARRAGRQPTTHSQPLTTDNGQTT